MDQLLEKKNWAALLAVKGVGRQSLRRCIQTQTKLKVGWKEFWVGKSRLWSKCALSEKQQSALKKFKNEHTVSSYWNLLLSKRIRVISSRETAYPRLLKTIDDQPPLLFVKGTTDWDKLPIAVVGTRNITSYGRLVTKKITSELVARGATIISGFMYGVDICAQQTALKKQGQTVGVLGFGFDHMYPARHQQLFEEMRSQGAVFISEYPPHFQPSAGNFPTRNRIIAGMSLGCVITEAAQRSGSLITAWCAGEYGRDVFAVPGSITNPLSEGTKDLVNQGAMLVSSGREVIAAINYRIDCG